MKFRVRFSVEASCRSGDLDPPAPGVAARYIHGVES